MKKFLGVYSKWGHDAKCMYAKMTMEKDFNKLVAGYEKCTGSDVKVQKIRGALDKTLSKSEL